jgi:hypothetical protein
MDGGGGDAGAACSPKNRAPAALFRQRDDPCIGCGEVVNVPPRAF